MTYQIQINGEVLTALEERKDSLNVQTVSMAKGVFSISDKLHERFIEAVP